MTGNPSSAAVRFGLFAFDRETGVLSRDGIPVRLQPQPARVLAALIDRAGDLVTREELRQTIWGNETFVDFERSLNFCIAQIRSALGDSATSPRFIETLPKRGYRFIAPVSGLAPAAAPVAEAQPVAPSGRRRRHWIAAAVLTLVAGIAAAALQKPPYSPAAPIRVAVVPFDNETGVTEYDRIALAVADATVARLATPARLKQLAVIGNAAVLHRPRAFRDLKAIGEELGAEYVVLAQVKSDAAGVRIIAHLIRTSDQAHVWANTFDRAAFTLDVQAELAEAIAAAVSARLESTRT